MKQMNHFYIGVIALVFMACSDNVNELSANGEICLNAVVGEIESRSAYLGNTPTPDNKLKVSVWFSESDVDFLHQPAGDTNLPCRTVMEFDGSPVFAYVPGTENKLKYQAKQEGNDYVPVYCVGFYPAEDAWSTEDGKIVNAIIDGTKDLMFAHRISGTWSGRFGTTNDNQFLHFEHLLSWVKVCVCATSQKVSEAWGKITEISISSKTNVSVNAITGIGTYSVDDEIPVLESTEGIDLHTYMQEVGSVFCSPALKYTVTLKIGGKTVSKELEITAFDGVTLEDADDAKGKLFILTLYFNEFDVMDAVCTLNAWDAQNEDLYMK